MAARIDLIQNHQSNNNPGCACRYLPPAGSKFRIQFSASVFRYDESVDFTLDWPEIVKRYDSDVEGETKRIYQKYGSANILSVKVKQNGDHGEF